MILFRKSFVKKCYLGLPKMSSKDHWRFKNVSDPKEKVRILVKFLVTIKIKMLDTVLSKSEMTLPIIFSSWLSGIEKVKDEPIIVLFSSGQAAYQFSAGRRQDKD
jgi:hypothetical protein